MCFNVSGIKQKIGNVTNEASIHDRTSEMEQMCHQMYTKTNS